MTRKPSSLKLAMNRIKVLLIIESTSACECRLKSLGF
jgi:hypothetical protein